MKNAILVIVVVTALLGFSQNVSCQEGIPTERIRTILEGVIAIQSDPQLKGQYFRNKRRESIKEIIARNFDFSEMAKKSLGQHWEGLEGAKRLEFRAIFQNLFQDSYTRLVLNFLGREKILFTKEEIDHGHALVKTTIARPNEEIPVDYSLTAVGEKWLVEDVKIDGVSIVENYQKSFSRVIKLGSYETLLQKMRLQQKTIDGN
jgi:phospholipid transport system substrate-binding protein